MKLAITRARNEMEILPSTINRLKNHFDGVIAFDDASNDGTREYLSEEPFVISIISNLQWETNAKRRHHLETSQRQQLYSHALKYNPEWVLYFDADEHFYFDEIDFTREWSYFFRLFDVYITPSDVKKPFLQRNKIGCEYRDIPMLFRPNGKVHFYNRVPLDIDKPLMFGGTVKHFGKGISVQHWEDTCDYYINFMRERMPNGEDISDKWRRRKGKAIHTESDFGNPLIEWHQRYMEEKIINMKFVDK